MAGWVTLALLFCFYGAVAVVDAGPAAAAATASETFADTTQVLTGTVPAGVCSVTFDVYGGSGYSTDPGSASFLGGLGGHVRATLKETVGSTFTVKVGSIGGLPDGGVTAGVRTGGNGGTRGDSATYAGGGGGYTEVVAGSGARIIAAGGGGAGERTGDTSAGGVGGGGWEGYGASGAGLLAVRGMGGDLQGGDPGAAWEGPGSAGSSLMGGNGGGIFNRASGGGGGGYFGGGGGSAGWVIQRRNQGWRQGGGGGGSNLAPNDATINGAAADGGDGKVVATYNGCPTIPDAPINLTAAPNHNAVLLTFTPASDGNDPITGYEETHDGGSTWTPVTTSAGNAGTLQAVVSGLTDGTSYTFQLRTVNGQGNSAPSATATTVPQPSAPGPVTALTAASGDASATLTFTAPIDDGGSPITSYEVSSDGGATWQTVATKPGTGGTLTATVTGLTNGTLATVGVRARNSIGAADQTSTTVTPDRSLTVPSVPLQLDSAAAPGQYGWGINLRFDDPSNDGGTVVTGYDYSIDGGTTWKTLSLASTGPNTAFLDFVTPGTHHVTVRANNSVGAGAATSHMTVEVPDVPHAPTALTATALDGGAHLVIEQGADGGSPLTLYEYSTNHGATWHTLPVTLGAGPRTVDIAGLSNGTAHTIDVRALNAVGGGAAASVSVTPASADKPVVAPSRAPAPANVLAPTITGSPTAGKMLTAEHGTWTREHASYRYQWRRDGKAITDATDRSYVLTRADGDHWVSVQVTATDANGHASAISDEVLVTKESATSTPGSTEPTQPGTTPPGGVTIAAPVLVSGVTVTAQDEVALPLECPVGPSGCNADGALMIDAQAVSTASFRADVLSQQVLGTFAGAQIASGQSQLVSVRLDPATITTLRQRGVSRVLVTLTINDHLTGGPVATTVAHVWLNISPLPGVCPVPTGSLAGTVLGPVALGDTQAHVRAMLPRFARYSYHTDNFCLAGGPGIRVGYASARLLGEAHMRPGLAGRIVLALTANRYYTLDGVRPGARVAAVAGQLRLGQPLRLGRNTWYTIHAPAGTGVLKVRHGVIEEVGIANRQITGDRAAERLLLSSF
ncbi:MAG: fibronectin type III domain-containing protein [Solirubrobacteraceae bacterium]